MSAAATAAGYLYASGRLRGRTARDEEHQEHKPEPRTERPRRPERPAPADRPVRVAVLKQEQELEQVQEQEKPRRTPKIEYRVRRRWSPE